jgi:hypothetical protein
MMQSTHPWKARFIVGLVMIVLAFIGMVLTDVRKEGGWDYWKWMVPVYAILALWLSWYVKRGMQTIRVITMWHEVLHWVGLILAIFLVAHLVQLGIISRFIAGIFHLILLSLALFLAGIYIEPTFIVIGIILGFFGLFTAIFVQNMYVIAVPILIGGALLLAISLWVSHQRSKKEP